MRWKRLVARISIITLTGFASLMVLLDSCMQFRSSEKEIDEYFADKPRKGTIESYYVGKQRINYLTVGSASRKFP